MSYTFDEAYKTVDAFDKDLELESWMPDSRVYEIIDKLKQEYEPTVEMTVTEKEVMTRFINCSFSFTQLIEVINGEYATHDMLFHEVEKAFKKRVIRDGYVLNERPLMQAWLYPETIKLIGENNFGRQ